MRSTLVAVATLGLLSGCIKGPSTDPSAGEVKGTPADVATQAGAYEGFAVVRPCPARWMTDATRMTTVGVRGTGSHPLTTTDEISAFAADVRTTVADVPSVDGGFGYGLACEE